MKKPKRNAPCTCGSGKKYKKCCLIKSTPPTSFVYTNLDKLSNKIPRLIESGKLFEAEGICLQLKDEYPDQIDWIERYATVLEARGEYDKAADYYRKAAAFAKKEGGFDQRSIDHYLSRADLLTKKQ